MPRDECLRPSACTNREQSAGRKHRISPYFAILRNSAFSKVCVFSFANLSMVLVCIPPILYFLSVISGESQMAAVSSANGFTLSNCSNDAMVAFASEALAKNFSQLSREFERVDKFVPSLEECSAFSKFDGENSNSNWLHYPCLDRTRVTLLGKDTEEAAYIHANYVRDPPLTTSFIAALAPELETVDNFVTLIWQERVEKVVMLCRLQEIKWRKSEDYYPRIVGQELNISGISVKCIEKRVLEKGIISTSLQLRRNDEIRTVEHVHVTDWPDFGVSNDVHLVLDLLEHIRKSAGPVLVHCGSGVGRTGTLLAIEISIQTLLSGQNLSVKDVVKQLRAQRAYAIETDVQYGFVMYCTMAYLRRQNVVSQKKLDSFAIKLKS